MKNFVIISDTHGQHKGSEKKFNFPSADFIIHCGDISGSGKEHVIKEFLDWYSSLDQYKYKIFIAGNHDRLFEDYRIIAKGLLSQYSNVIYLEDSGIEIEGIKFWGSPVSKPFNNWAFNKSEARLAQHWSAIPDDIDILITHNPPHSIMDYTSFSRENIGSKSLYIEVFKRIKPKIHCFGHVHEEYGIREINGIRFINASLLDDKYELCNLPTVVELET